MARSQPDNPPLLIQALPWRDPADLFAAIGDRPGSLFLDSASDGDPRSAFSYVAVDPADEIRLHTATMDDVEAALRTLAMPATNNEHPLPFTGGLVGMISYDCAAAQMAGLKPRTRDDAIPDFVVRRYDLVFGFDRQQRRAWGFARDRDGQSAQERITALFDLPTVAPAASGLAQWREDTSANRHAEQIAGVLDYIAAGDIYQANITARLTSPLPDGFSPVSAYLDLRRRSPAPFGACMDLGAGCALISASPERFVQCGPDGRIETRPIKGTIPRDHDPARDRANAERLAGSAKDVAENLMICDLLRNDLSIVSVPGSVEVSQLAALEGFSSVWHLVSAVHGQLAPGRDAIDLLRATLPGGSITGAPKKRAIEIIDELEDSRRGPFYGTLFWLGDDGAMDSSLIIRSIVATPDRLIAAAGGGIVADSDPQAEYAELRAKIDPILEAFGPKP